MRGQSLFGLILLLTATISTADESFPYRVAVKSHRVTLRSGPGSQFYATGYVAAGDEIEVYQRRQGGWLAIRPPETSFNWVAASKLRMTDDPELAKVVGNNVVAWIGSELDAVEDHQWQVKLDPGETVRLIARQSMSIFRGDQPRDFYQIAPPAGDFRWVLERDIEPLVEQSAAVASRSEVRLAQFRVVDEEGGGGESESASASASAGRLGEPSDGARVASLAPRTGFRPRDAGQADFDSLAKMLDVELSATVAREPTQWKLASLHQDAAALVEQSETTLHRGKARMLLEKIKEFERLQLRYAGIEDSAAGTPTADSPSTDDASAASPIAAGFDPRFDGRGWLLPVHSSRQASPPYALLDQRGQILTFVSPAPGLNLHRYLRKEVGVFGQRSRAEFLGKPHLTADRIIDIQRHRR